jgi:hypothetical protein
MTAKALLSIVVALVACSSPAFAQEAPGWEEAPGPADSTDTEAEPDREAPSPKSTETKPAAASSEPEHEHRRWHHRSGGEFAVSIGKAHLEAQRLDERLQALGYEPLSEHAITFGLSGIKVFECGLVLGVGASYTRGRESDGPKGATARVDVGHLYGLLGATVADTRRWLVYPAAMVGGYRLKLNLDASGSANFDDVASDPKRSSEITQQGWFVGGVLAIDRRIRWYRDSNRYTSIGLRFGVMEALSASDWQFGDDTAHSGPKALPRVGFAALALGFGRYGQAAAF